MTSVSKTVYIDKLDDTVDKYKEIRFFVMNKPQKSLKQQEPER